MTENLFESAFEITARNSGLATGLTDFWYQTPAPEEDYSRDLRVEIEKVRPFNQHNAPTLNLIALRVKQAEDPEIWHMHEPEWIQALAPQLPSCPPYEIGNVMARIRDLRTFKARHLKTADSGQKFKDREIPAAFLEPLWGAINRVAPHATIEDLSKILSGISHEELNPPPETWRILNRSCAKAFKNSPYYVSHTDLMNLCFGYGGMLQQMRQEFKEPYFKHFFASPSVRAHDFVNLGRCVARLADGILDDYEDRYYDILVNNWDNFRPATQARAIWSTAVFSVLKPLPDSATDFLSSLTSDNVQSLLKSEHGTPLPVAAYRLFPDPDTEPAFRDRSSLFKPLDPAFINKVGALGFPVTMRNDKPCAVSTPHGTVLVQVHPDHRYVHDENGGRRTLKGSRLLKTAVGITKYSEPMLHVSEWAEQQMTDVELTSLLNEAATMPRGAYKAVRFPKQTKFRIKPLQIEPAPDPIRLRTGATARAQAAELRYMPS